MRKVFFKNKYFPNQIDICLLVCTKNCSHAYLGTSNFIHYCDCGNEFKKIYNMEYELANKKLFNKCKFYDQSLSDKGNQDESLDWIDDITFDDLINGKVDCIGDIKEIYIALAVCSKECGHIQLIYDGAPQVCPKCRKQLFRVTTKKYKLKKLEN